MVYALHQVDHLLMLWMAYFQGLAMGEMPHNVSKAPKERLARCVGVEPHPDARSVVRNSNLRVKGLLVEALCDHIAAVEPKVDALCSLPLLYEHVHQRTKGMVDRSVTKFEYVRPKRDQVPPAVMQLRLAVHVDREVHSPIHQKSNPVDLDVHGQHNRLSVREGLGRKRDCVHLEIHHLLQCRWELMSGTPS